MPTLKVHVNRPFAAADTSILLVVYTTKRYSFSLLRILVYYACFTACMDVHFNFLRINIERPGDEASPAAQSELLILCWYALH